MPCDYRIYPHNWKEFRIAILARALLQCECQGQCGHHTPNPMQRRCCELQHKKAQWFKGNVRLTIAHLCKCAPPCANPSHVIAACQKCHLRIDRYTHAKKRLATQEKKRHPSVGGNTQ